MTAVLDILIRVCALLALALGVKVIVDAWTDVPYSVLLILIGVVILGNRSKSDGLATPVAVASIRPYGPLAPCASETGAHRIKRLWNVDFAARLLTRFVDGSSYPQPSESSAAAYWHRTRRSEAYKFTSGE